VAPTCFWDWTNKVRLSDVCMHAERNVHRIVTKRTKLFTLIVVGLASISSILEGLSIP
jgi:hypothetical protein